MIAVWSGFVIGLIGSLHCIGMCGPIALALPRAGGSKAAWVAGRAVYNAGRIVTYAMMGIFFGAVGKTMALAGLQQTVSIVAGVLLLLAVILGTNARVRLSVVSLFTRPVQLLKDQLGPMLKKRGLTTLFLIGLLNGLLPCGLVYVALAGAAVSGSAAMGMATMAAFGLGTFPVMFAVSLSGGLLQSSFRHRFQKAIPVAVAVIAILFILRGMSLGIPYVSPDMSGDQPAGCCSGSHPEGGH